MRRLSGFMDRYWSSAFCRLLPSDSSLPGGSPPFDLTIVPVSTQIYAVYTYPNRALVGVRCEVQDRHP